MEKDFDRWNRHKKKVNDVADRPFYHTREIWWCAVGDNVGNELDGPGKEHDRPVLVIRPFNAETFFGVALIGHPRVGRFYFPLGKVDDREGAHVDVVPFPTPEINLPRMSRARPKPYVR
jgi:hypothetical protein